MRNTRNWLNGQNVHPSCGFYVEDHGEGFSCPPDAFAGPPKSDREEED